MSAVDFTPQETLKLISDAVTKGGDNFRMRVQRRPRGGGIPDMVALFEDARAEHFAYPERWLPELAGGGQFILQALHSSDSLREIGSGIHVNVDNAPPKAADPAITSRPDWEGPRTMSHPKPRKQGTQQVSGSINGSESTPIGVDVQQPRTLQTPIPRGDNSELYWMERAQRTEAEAAERLRRAEIEAIRRDADAKTKALEDTVRALREEIRAQRSEGPKQSGLETIVAALAPLTPVLTAIIQGQNEGKLKMLELQQQTAAQQLAAQQAANERLDKLLQTMMQKPPMDPMATAMLDTLKDALKKEDNGTGAIMTNVITALSSMSQSTLQILTAATDAGIIGQRGDEGGGTGEVVKELARAGASFFEMMAASKQEAATQTTQPRTVQGQRVQQALPQARQTPQQPRPTISALQRLDAMVRSYADPAATAKVFLDGLGTDRQLREAFTAANNDIQAFFAAHWEAWARKDLGKTMPYIQKLYEVVVEQAKARGMIRDVKPAADPGPAAPTPSEGISEPEEGAEEPEEEPREPLDEEEPLDEPAEGDEQEAEGD